MRYSSLHLHDKFDRKKKLFDELTTQQETISIDHNKKLISDDKIEGAFQSFGAFQQLMSMWISTKRTVHWKKFNQFVLIKQLNHWWSALV